MGLVFVMLTGCIDASVVGRWEFHDFQRFEINQGSYSTSEEVGELSVDGGREFDFDFEMETADFGTLAWGLDGTWEGVGDGLFRFDARGEIRFTNRYGQLAGLDLQGNWDCTPAGDRMDCVGALDAPEEADETYSFEIDFSKR